jgi:hypothetical protein
VRIFVVSGSIFVVSVSILLSYLGVIESINNRRTSAICQATFVPVAFDNVLCMSDFRLSTRWVCTGHVLLRQPTLR